MYDGLISDWHVERACACSRIVPHHFEMHMLLLDKLGVYFYAHFSDSLWAGHKHKFYLTPKNVKMLSKLINKSCAVLPKPDIAQEIILRYLIKNGNELTSMVFITQ